MCGIINTRSKRESHDGTDPGGGHQSPTDWINPHKIQQHAVKFCELGAQRRSRIQEGTNDGGNERMPLDEFTNAVFEFDRANYADVKPEIAQ